jgi:hypothetical protein
VANLNITNIPAPRVPFIDERTGLMAREWYRFFLNLFVLTGSGNNPITLEELQLGPPNPARPDRVTDSDQPEHRPAVRGSIGRLS